mgnify:CR=1 FL=1
MFHRKSMPIEFSASKNTQDTFHAPNGDKTVTFMNKKLAQMYYYYGDKFSAVALGLKNGSLMWFILPDEGYTTADVLADGQYMQMVLQQDWENTKWMKVNLSVPKFDANSTINLKDGLQEMGVTDVFNELTSNFNEITGDVPIYLTAANQSVRVQIDEEGVKALVEKIHAEVGQIDILVNNAGIIKRIPMHEMKRAEFQQVIDIDLVAPYICAAAVLPEMMERREGKIINICSMMSELGRETVSAYAAAKGGLKMLTRNICSEYGEYNIQCNGIGPGYIATPQTAPLRERQADGSRHPFDAFIVAKTPAERWGTPEDLMGPAVFLASEASDFVNGHVLYVDGGILAYIGKQPK